MSLNAIAWLFTLGVLAHNAEEAWLLPAWSSNAGRWHAPVGAPEFRFAVTVLSAALVIIAGLASISGPAGIPAYLLAGYALAMVLNVVAPHLLATMALRRYMPGTATAICLNLPLGTLFLTRALNENYVEKQAFYWSGPLTALAMVASIPLLFNLGRRLHSRGA